MATATQGENEADGERNGDEREHADSSWADTLAEHVQRLVHTATSEHVEHARAELVQVARAFGMAGCVHVLRAVLLNCSSEDSRGTSSSMRMLLEAVAHEAAGLTGPAAAHALSSAAACAQSSTPMPSLSDVLHILQLSLAEELLLLVTLWSEPGSVSMKTESDELLREHIADIFHSFSLRAINLELDVVHRLLLFLRANASEFKHELHNVIASVKASYNADEIPLNLRTILYSDENDTISVRRVLQDGLEGAALQEHLDHSVKHAKVIEEIGYACTASPETFAAVLDMLPPLNESSVAEIMSMMARTYSGLDGGGATFLALNAALGEAGAPEPGHCTTWSVDIAIDVLLSRIHHVSMTAAMMHLDHPEFYIPDQTAFTLLMQMFNRATTEHFPIEAICGRLWANTEGQLSLLYHAVNASPEVFSFQHSPNIQAPLEGLTSNKHALGTPNQCWLSLDLIGTLFDLAEAGHYAKVRNVFEQPRKQCPEVLFVGIAEAKSWTVLQSELLSAMMPSFISNHTNSSIVMHRLWHRRRDVVLQGMMDVYARDRSYITRVLDVCQDLKQLGTVLQETPYQFALDLAALASRREYLNIEKWLGERITEHGTPFVKAVIQFLNGVAEESRLEKRPAVSVSEETQALFIKVLQQRAEKDIAQPEASEVNKACDDLIESNERLQSLLAESQTYGQFFSEDVEDDANNHFQHLYDGKMSAGELTETLGRYRSSGGPHEKQVLACIIRNLLDEYRFFPRYPERELRLTASLFGAIIRRGLLEPLTLGLALRLILDSLRKDPSNHMYIFGSVALEQFTSRALQWRQFCEQLLHSPHLPMTHPDLIKTIEKAHMSRDQESLQNGARDENAHVSAAAAAADSMVSSQQRREYKVDGTTTSLENRVASVNLEGGKTQGERGVIQGHVQRQEHQQLLQQRGGNLYVPSSSSTTSAATRTFGGNMSPETMEKAEANAHIVEPEESVQNHVHFIFNNLTDSNIEQKAEDLANFLREEDYEWFANHVVVKRVSMEGNLHSLYMDLIERLNDPRLQRLLLQATYRNVKVVVADQKCKHSLGERSILKNLGTWLGEQTIAKNRPVLQKDLDLKQLLIEAYKTGRLIAVLPFVTRVLEPAKNSKVFAPPNPWVMAILSLLVEIYNLPDLKLNNKFEIERLFKQLNARLEEITPTRLLEGVQRQQDGNSDFATEKKAASLPDARGTERSSAAGSHAQVGKDKANERSKDDAFPMQMRQEPAAAAAFQQEQPTTQAYAMEQALQAPQKKHSQAPQLMAQPPSFASVPAAAVQLVDYNPPQIAPSVQYTNLVTMNPQLSAHNERINLRQCLEHAIGSAVNDAYPPILERSVKIACNTTQFLVLKDFALEPDENRVKKAAVHMACNLAGGLALVTVRESMKQHLSHKLTQILQQNGYDQYVSNPQIQELANDNADLCCGMVEQAAIARASKEIDEMLKPAFDGRKQHRDMTPSKPFYDTSQLPPNMLNKIPESLRPQTTYMNQRQQQIYDAFKPRPQLMTELQEKLSRHPGVEVANQQSPVDRADLSGFPDRSTSSTQQHTSQPAPRAHPSGQSEVQHITDVYTVCIQRIEAAAAQEPQSTIETLASEHEARIAIAELGEALHHSHKPEDGGLSVSKRAFARACDYANVPLYVTSLVAIIATAASASNVLAQQMPREVTSWLIQSEDQHKYNRSLIEPLIRRKLVILTEFDRHLAKEMIGVRSAESAEFAQWLLNKCVHERIANVAELPNVLETLRKIAYQSNQTDLLRLAEQARALSHESTQTRGALQGQPQQQQVHQQAHVPNVHAEADANGGTMATQQVPPGRRSVPQTPQAVQEQVAQLFDEWARLTDKAAGDTLYVSFFAKLQNAGVLLPEDNQEQFFRIMTEIAVAHCQHTDWRLQQSSVNAMPPPALNFVAVDAYIRLLLTLVRTLPEAANSAQSTSTAARLGILARGINAITSTLLRHADERPGSFNPRPYLRMFSGLLIELNAPDVNIDLSRPEVLALLSNAFLTVQPRRVPPMAVAWLELVSDRCFMPRLLMDHKRRGWPLMNKLLSCLLKFMEPYLREAKLTEALRLLYKGTLRVMLVILHDFPEFFIDYHTSFCDVLPPSCIQLRNVVLSAYPTGMKLPDPFTPDLKVDLLPSMRESPSLNADFDAEVRKRPIRSLIDSYLIRREPLSIAQEMLQAVQLNQQDAIATGTMYNVPLLNAMVLYIGIHAINLCEQRKQQPVPMSGSAETELFMMLVEGLNEEGRYHVLNAITNQLRYPNNHTHFFSCLLLFIFAEAPHEGLKEQITRVLLERLLANRPHPWGLLITFIELLKNPKYNFWRHSFAHCDPYIERLFEKVTNAV